MIRDNAFESVKKALRAKYGSDIYISDSELSDNVPSFPAVSVTCSNYVNRQFTTFDKIENMAVIEYTVNVYTNDTETKDEQAIEIMTVICDAFSEMYYLRTYEEQITNMLDNSITRRTARFIRENVA